LVVFSDPGSIGAVYADGLFEARSISGLFVCASLALEGESSSVVARLASGLACRVNDLADVRDGASLRAAVEQLSDLFRGETIVVVAATNMLRDALAPMSELPITVAIDSDGWIVQGRTGAR
jgi:hypothetical protein